MIYRFAPPVMPLRHKNFHRNSLRSDAPPTPEQPDFASANPQISRPGGTRNPPVLLSPEMVCSVRQHPLSGTSGRKRYNTLDFARQNRVPTGRFRPYWKPGIKGICHPFEISARFEICIYKPEKRCLHLHIPKRKKAPEFSSNKERNSLELFNAAFIVTGEIHASCTAAALHFSEHSPVFRRGKKWTKRALSLSSYLHL